MSEFVNHEDLLTLAEFLDEVHNDPVLREQWKFTSWNSKWGKQAILSGHATRGCGTVGCAIGLLPMLFPDVAYHHYISLVSGDRYIVEEQYVYNGTVFSGGTRLAISRFSLTYDEAEMLFLSGEAEGRLVTPGMVASNIYQFVREFAGVPNSIRATCGWNYGPRYSYLRFYE